MKKKNIVALILSIALCQLAGVIGSVFTIDQVKSWYPTLIKPALNPPSWVFGPVWVTLFILMGIAAFLVWKQGILHKKVKIALGIFGIQLVLNTLWSILFFGFQNPGAALVEIAVLWLTILASIIAFYKISKPAAYLLLPYILWVSFASYLNYAIWSLNS